MSFDSDCRSGASPGENPLWGKKAWNRGYMTFDSRQLPFIIISIVIHHHHRHRHHHCRHHHHHHHHHVSCVLFSRLHPPAFFQATLSSSVFIQVPYHFWSKTSSSISPFRYLKNSSNFAAFCCSMFLEPCLGNCSLGHVAWHLFIATLLGNLFLGALLGHLFLGAYS